MNHTCCAVAAPGAQPAPSPQPQQGPAPLSPSAELLCSAPLGSQRSQGQEAATGTLCPGLGCSHSTGNCATLGSVGGSGAEPPHREGGAVETTLSLPKCFSNNNRYPCPSRRISIRDFKVEAGKLRHREGVQVRQIPVLVTSFPLCAYLMGKISMPSPIRTTHSDPRLGNRQPQVPLSSRASLIPAMARGQGQHCPPSPASARHCSRCIGAGSGLTCPALHRGQHLCSSRGAGRADTVDTAGTCQSSPHTPRGHVGKAINWNDNRSTGKNCILTTREGCSATVLYHKSHLYDLPSVSQITRVQSPMSAFKSEHGIFSQK